MIVAVTVTYNSSISLEKTINALLSQTISVDKIVIADNNSNEQNKAHVKELAGMSDKIEVVWLDDNTGGAGGFYASMKYAKENYSPDWYWLMDDDAYPQNDCLETLIDYSKKLDNIGFLAPVIWGIDKEQYQLYHARKKYGFIYKFNPISNNIDEIEEVNNIDVDAFVGPLISGKIVEECGLPRAEYFIEGDDTDYTFRISRKHTGYLIKKAQMNHRDIVPKTGINPEGWWKDYYWYRNTILFSLNNLNGISRFISLVYVLLWAYKSKWKMYKNPEYHDYKKFRWKIMKKGINDGLRRKGGANLLPQDYKKMLKEWEQSNIGR